MFTLACGDVMPGCTATFSSSDRSALLTDVARHADADHGVTEITPEIFAQVDGRIVETA